MNHEDLPGGCYTPNDWLIAQGKEPLLEGFAGFAGESENEFSPFQAARRTSCRHSRSRASPAPSGT